MTGFQSSLRRLLDERTSRHHAVLRFLDGAWTLHDLESANGTWVGGERRAKAVRPAGGQEIRDYGLYGWALSRFAATWAGVKCVKENIESTASIDGANAWQRFRRITLPLLTPVIFFNAVLLTIQSFQGFTQAYVISRGSGGPADSNEPRLSATRPRAPPTFTLVW